MGFGLRNPLTIGMQNPRPAIQNPRLSLIPLPGELQYPEKSTSRYGVYGQG